jgi:hypothetical protein
MPAPRAVASISKEALRESPSARAVRSASAWPLSQHTPRSSAALDGGAQRGPEPLAPRLEVGEQVLVVVSEPELMHRRRAQLE